jgi:hypothetical protein
MCLLSYYPPGVMPVREHLENGARLNQHGWGFALGYVAMRSADDPERMISQFMAHRQRFPYLPALFHSRNATGDSPLALENVHPFPVSRDGEPMMFVAHNGYLFDDEGDKSDSRVFAEQILPRYDLDDPGQRALLESRMEFNKAVILHPDGAWILNAHLGVSLADGTWHSNLDYLGVPHVISGFCGVCRLASPALICDSCRVRAGDRKALLMDKA